MHHLPFASLQGNQFILTGIKACKSYIQFAHQQACYSSNQVHFSVYTCIARVITNASFLCVPGGNMGCKYHITHTKIGYKA